MPATGLDDRALSGVVSALHADLRRDDDEPSPVDEALAACVRLAYPDPRRSPTTSRPRLDR